MLRVNIFTAKAIFALGGLAEKARALLTKSIFTYDSLNTSYTMSLFSKLVCSGLEFVVPMFVVPTLPFRVYHKFSAQSSCIIFSSFFQPMQYLR